MKKKKLLLLMIAGVALCLCSCKKENFNFDRLGNEFDVSGEWGLSLLQAEYSIEELLKNFQTDNLIEQDANGTLFFNYDFNIDEGVSSDQFLKVENISENTNWKFDNIPPIPVDSISTNTTIDINNSFSFASDKLLIKNAVIESGTITITTTPDFNNVYMTEIVFPQIKDPAGNTFVLKIIQSVGGVNTTTVNLNNYTITPLEGNQLTYTGEATIYRIMSPVPSEMNIDFTLDIKDIKFKSFTGKMAAHSFVNDETVNIDIFPNTVRGGLTIYKPRLSLFVDNVFNIPVRQTITTATLSPGFGVGGSSLLNQNPTHLNISASQSSRDEILISELDQLYINTDYNTLKLTGETVVNPDGFSGGECHFNSSSKINARASFRIPFSLKVDELIFADTSDFNLASLDIISGIESVELRVGITNTIPLNLYMQIYFQDETSGAIIDSLFTTPVAIRGQMSPSDKAVESVIMQEISNEKVQRISPSKMIMHYQVNTSQNAVNLRSSNGIKASVRAKIKYNQIDLSAF